jgi:hypothetical protein
MLLALNPPFSRFYVSFSSTVGLVDARWHSEVNILQKDLALDAVHIEQDILCAVLNRINFLSGRFCRVTDRLLRAGARNSERSRYVFLLVGLQGIAWQIAWHKLLATHGKFAR